MKNEKGITLIALIITIIVMLILVAVTVNVAINGGLFGNANDAAKDTEREAIYDQIVSAMVLTDNGKINVKQTYDAVNGMLTITETNPEEVRPDTAEVEITVQGKKGTYKYTIMTDKIIEETTEDEEPITEGGEDPEIQTTTGEIDYDAYYRVTLKDISYSDIEDIPEGATLAFIDEGETISQFMKRSGEFCYFPINTGNETYTLYQDNTWSYRGPGMNEPQVVDGFTLQLNKVKFIPDEMITAAELEVFTKAQIDALITYEKVSE